MSGKHQINDGVVELTEQLERGVLLLRNSDKFKEYLQSLSKFHSYSVNNTILIALQMPTATRVAGYTTWNRDFHRQVNKGEKGIRILAPAPYKTVKEEIKRDPVTQEVIIGSDGTPETEKVQVTVPAYKVTTVFDISQTSGEPLPEVVHELQGNVDDYDKFFEALKEVSPVPIELKKITDGSNGYYHLVDKKIAIREGMSQMQTIKTGIHELSHAMLHDRETGKEKAADTYTKEVEAESIAYTVCQHYGIDSAEYSFGYIAGWSSSKTLEELKNSMNTIRATASEIITELDKKLYPTKDKNAVEEKAIEKKKSVGEERRTAFIESERTFSKGTTMKTTAKPHKRR